jgi:hypothetical protein
MTNDETPASDPAQQPGNASDGEHHEHSGVQYEPIDVSLSRIINLLVIALCVLAGTFYGTWLFFTSREHAQEEVKRSPFPLAAGPSTALPPQPRLEQLDRMTPAESQAVDIDLMKQEQELHRYGKSADKGFVQVPIEQAIKAVAAKLPVAKGSSPGRDGNGLVDDGQSNSGRMFRGVAP